MRPRGGDFAGHVLPDVDVSLVTTLVMKEFQTFAGCEHLSVVAALQSPPGTSHASDAVLDRTHFFALLDAAVCVAEPGSAPTLMLIDLDPAAYDQISSLETAARTVAGVLGRDGFVGMLRGGRLAVMMASDTLDTDLGSAVIECLARPVRHDGTTASAIAPDRVAHWGVAHWGVDGTTAEELFVAADHRVHAAHLDRAALAKKGKGVRFVTSPLQV